MQRTTGGLNDQRRRSARVLVITATILLLGMALHPATAATTGKAPPTPPLPGLLKPPRTTTTTQPPTTTSSTSTTAAPTTTSTSTTTTAPPPPPGGSGNPTGLTRARVTIDTSAAWVELTMHGVNIDLSRVVSTSGDARIVSLGGQEIGVTGAGRVVIEMVLAVADGAATSLEMCKNYLGPASVTVSRLTDGDTVVASMTNSGSTWVFPAGSCENHQTGALDRAALLGPVRWPARVDPRRLVLAHYYPWYNDDTLLHHFGDQPVGPAHSSDPAQVAAAVDLAVGAGINGFVVEYDATPYNAPGLEAIYAEAGRRTGFELALMLDFAILQYRGTGLDAAGLDAALGEVARRASHPNQLEVNGQPVVFLYKASLVNQTMWTDALARLRARTGLIPFVVADGHLQSPGQHLYGTHHLGDVPSLQSWADYTRWDLRARPGLDGRSGPLFVAPVGPGYDDSRLGRPTPVVVDRREGARYDETWDAALDTLPDWVVITTWNEYYEQSHLMPGSDSGTLALERTAAWTAEFRRTG